jgi:hypothetical protein
MVLVDRPLVYQRNEGFVCQRDPNGSAHIMARVNSPLDPFVRVLPDQWQFFTLHETDLTSSYSIYGHGWPSCVIAEHRALTGILKVDDKEVATKKVPHTIPFLMAIDETFDVGVDSRTPVDDKDYQVPFRFTGKLDKLTIKLGPTQLTSDDHQVIQHNLAKARD